MTGKLVIDLLAFERGKAYGFEEYALNLLNDFKKYRDRLNCAAIILVIRDSQVRFFQEYFNDYFELEVMHCACILHRLIISQSVPRRLNLCDNDAILYLGNTIPLTGRKTKTIVVIHDLLYVHSDLFEKNIHSIFFRIHRCIYVPWSIKHATKIITISRAIREEIIGRYNVDESKVLVIYNYFHFEKYQNSQDISQSIVAGPYILTICSEAKHKNHRTILRAFNLLCQERRECKLVFVGKLPKMMKGTYDSLSEAVRGRIVFLEHLSNSEMANIYRNASLYVSASLYEGLGMPVVEALFFGLPLVLSDIKIHHEISFDSAFFFNPTSANELCDGFQKVLSHPFEINAERKIQIQIFSSEHTSLRYISEINGL